MRQADTAQTEQAAARAIWALRRAIGGAPGCRLSGAEHLDGMEQELACIAACTGGICKLRLAMPGSLVLTKDERRLLNALAAAQAEDAELLDNYLYRLALNRNSRARLADAVQHLAACLAVHGYWLPRPSAALMACALLPPCNSH